MRILMTLISIGLAAYGVWWASTNHPEIKHKIEEVLDSGYFHTLEVRYTANQLMETHRQELLKSNRHKYLDPVLKFYPYLLLEVKYSLSDDKTNEGLILWDLLDGEMVVDTTTWEKTHGFGDCINANTARHEFKVLNLLAKKGGSVDREGLSRALQVENEVLDTWLDSCRKKKLVVQTGNRYRLHLQNPKLQTKPETYLHERLVTQPFRKAIRVPRRHSVAQIERLTKAAFGNDFSIRKTTDIFLPVHNIMVQNPDGSIHTSHWNALNGKPLSQNFFIE